MLKAYSWMFSQADLKKHILFITKNFVLLTIVALFWIFISSKLYSSPLMISVSVGIFALLVITPMFFLLGYFWNLTEKIIDRETDISASNIYDGKIREVSKIELPELNLFKHIWRGIASIVASILATVPYVFLLYVAMLSGALIYISPSILIVAYILYYLLTPALFWYYAKTNSVFAVLDIRKAIYVVGNYPLRYILAIFLFVVTAIANALVDTLVLKTLVPTNPSQIADITNPANILPLVGICLYVLVAFIKYLYLMFVNAYILGTITPPVE